VAVVAVVAGMGQIEGVLFLQDCEAEFFSNFPDPGMHQAGLDCAATNGCGGGGTVLVICSAAIHYYLTCRTHLLNSLKSQALTQRAATPALSKCNKSFL
jgi:hypothetical protein